MSCDKLVYDLASETEGSPNVFVRKDWLNILDNQNQNYNSNQSVVDTSQLSNSNKWMSYREAYFEMPLLLTLGCDTVGLGSGFGAPGFIGYNDGFQFDSTAAGAVGLKNWFGNMIHSFTLDYNGTTIVQQTPFVNMWNSFKLLTTLSWNDVETQGAHIGFYPDSSDSWAYNTVACSLGSGVTNNGLYNIEKTNCQFGQSFGQNQSNMGGTTLRNTGYAKRMSYIAYDPSSAIGFDAYPGFLNLSKPTDLLPALQSNQVWRSFITGRAGAAAVKGYIQYQVMATVYLKHIHSFFNMCPLLKGVYMKMTLNLNNSSSQIVATAATSATGVDLYIPGSLNCVSSSNAVNGVIPFLVSSADGFDPVKVAAAVGQTREFSGGCALTGFVGGAQNYYVNISVGAQILDQTLITQCSLVGVGAGSLSRSIYLYVPSYVFNPVFEQAYLSSPVKTVKYTDVYQYQVQKVAVGSFNQLITNGIANIKSVLIIPFYSPDSNGTTAQISSFQSPFDTAGCGTTAPLVVLNNFNIVVSGQNAIYNTERYSFEQFNNQMYGQNAVNGGLTDGLTSGLINYKDWSSNYGYYYVNVERMLPVEQSVPKSIQIVGTNATAKNLDLWVFVEYGNQINIDAITGARV